MSNRYRFCETFQKGILKILNRAHPNIFRVFLCYLGSHPSKPKNRREARNSHLDFDISCGVQKTFALNSLGWPTVRHKMSTVIPQINNTVGSHRILLSNVSELNPLDIPKFFLAIFKKHLLVTS